MRQLSAFSKRGAEKVVENKHGVKATKWEVDEYHNALSARNRNANRRKAEEAEIGLNYEGFDRPITRAEMGLESNNELRPMRNRWKKAVTRAELDAAIEAVSKQSHGQYWKNRDDLYKENYLRSLGTEFSQGSEEVQKLIDKINTNVCTTDEGC